MARASQRMKRYRHDGLASTEHPAAGQAGPQSEAHLIAELAAAAVFDSVEDLPIVAFRSEEQERGGPFHLKPARQPLEGCILPDLPLIGQGKPREAICTEILLIHRQEPSAHDAPPWEEEFPQSPETRKKRIEKALAHIARLD